MTNYECHIERISLHIQRGWRRMPSSSPRSLAATNAPCREALFSHAQSDELWSPPLLDALCEALSLFSSACISHSLRLLPNDSRPSICRHHFTPEMRLANALSYRARGVSDRERTRPEMTLSKVSSQRYFYKKTMCSFVLMCRRLSYDQ